MTSKTSSIAGEIYNETAAFGKIWSLMSAIMASLISILLIFLGIYILRLSERKVSAIITKINNTTGICDIGDLNCTIAVSYIYNNIELIQEINKPNNNRVYKIGDVIDVYIDNNGLVTTIQNPPPKIIGIVLIIVSIILLLSSWFWYWASVKYKVAATASGLGGVLNMVFSRTT